MELCHHKYILLCLLLYRTYPRFHLVGVTQLLSNYISLHTARLVTLETKYCNTIFSTSVIPMFFYLPFSCNIRFLLNAFDAHHSAPFLDIYTRGSSQNWLMPPASRMKTFILSYFYCYPTPPSKILWLINRGNNIIARDILMAALNDIIDYCVPHRHGYQFTSKISFVEYRLGLDWISIKKEFIRYDSNLWHPVY